jgi:hypothetical protein
MSLRTSITLLNRVFEKHAKRQVVLLFEFSVYYRSNAIRADCVVLTKSFVDVEEGR